MALLHIVRTGEGRALRPSNVDMARHSIRLLDTKSGRAARGSPSADDALALDRHTQGAVRRQGTAAAILPLGGPAVE